MHSAKLTWFNQFSSDRLILRLCIDDVGPEQLVVARLTKDFRVGSVTRDVVIQGPATVATGETFPMVFPVSHGEHLGREDLSGTTWAAVRIIFIRDDRVGVDEGFADVRHLLQVSGIP